MKRTLSIEVIARLRATVPPEATKGFNGETASLRVPGCRKICGCCGLGIQGSGRGGSHRSGEIALTAMHEGKTVWMHRNCTPIEVT